MMAKTSKRWIIPVRLNTKKPSSHPITRMSAIMYNRSLIIFIHLYKRPERNNMPRSKYTIAHIMSQCTARIVELYSHVCVEKQLIPTGV
jgi:hypothetical protein